MNVKAGGSKFFKERFLWIGFSIILIIVTLVLLLIIFGYKRKLTVTHRHEKMLKEEIQNLKWSLKQYEELSYYPELPDSEIEKLQKRGLENPIYDIIADLREHKELIPYKGVLGGTMGFYFENEIHVLTANYVFAYFEDGHISGCMLLKYHVSNNGEISWKVIDSWLDYNYNLDNN